MANLETLELTIQSNAQSAAQGIDTLITSLVSLSQAIIAPLRKLTQLNQQLQILQSYGKLKLPNFSGGGKPNVYTPQNVPLSQDQALGMMNAKEQELLTVKAKELAAAFMTNATAGVWNNKQLAEGALQLKGVTNRIEDLKKKSGEGLSVAEKLKKGFSNAFGDIAKTFEKIKRIAITMLIRKAIRGLVSAMKEGVNNVYGWSKATGGQFAEAMDKAKSSALLLKNSLGAMLSPVIQALIPLFNSLSRAIIDAANWLNQFISLLSGKTSWTKAVETATDATDGLADSASGAGSAAKEALAAFDELNVLSTPSGGSGGGIAAATADEYEGMFEEISKFDEKVKGLANFLKENLESIKDIALGIGTAILAWNLSKAFLEILPTLSTIFGYVGTGAVIAITLQAVWALTGEYLDTGKEGWLFASALTTAVGSVAAYAIAKKLIGGQAGVYAASITLALSAITDVVANLNSSDVSALSKESILTNIKAALEMGVATGLILKATTNASLSGILMEAGGVALITFGVATGLKALLDENVELFSLDSVKAAVITAVTTGLGLLAITKDVALSGGVALVTFGAYVGIKTILDENVEVFSAKSMIGAITAAVTTGLGLFVIGTSAAVATGAALVTFGAVIGIKAIVDDDIEWDSHATIVAALTAALPVGLGLFVLGASGSVAGIAAIATFAAVIGIKALVGANKESVSIEWGNISLTEEQVDAFVRTKMFTVNPKIFLDVSSESISLLKVDAESINAELKRLLGFSNVIRLGLASDDDYAAIKSNITGQGGLLDKIEKWINDEKTLSRRTITLMPQLFGSTPEEQSAWLSSDLAGWEAVQEFANNLGKQLADEIVEGESGEIEVKRPERVAKLIDEITRISEIIAGQDVATEAQIDLELKLKDLDHSSFNQAMQTWQNYKTQMQQAATEVAETMLANKTRLVNALKAMIEIDPDNDELKKQLAEAETGLEELKNNWQGIIDKNFAEFSEPGKSLIQEWVDSNFAIGSIKLDFNYEEWLKETINMQGLQQALDDIFTEAGFDTTVVSIDTIMEVGGWDLLNEDLQNNIIKYVGVKPNTVKTLKDQLKFNARDIVSLYNWDGVSDEEQLSFITALKDAFGASEAKAAAEEIGINIGSLVKKGMQSTNPDIQKQAQSWNDIVKEEVDNKTHKSKATLIYDEKKEQATANKLGGVVTDKKPKMKASLSYDAKKNAGISDKLSGLISDKKPKMKSALTFDEGKAVKKRDALAGYVSDKKTYMTSALTFDADKATKKRNALAEYVSDKKPLMTGAITYTKKDAQEKADALAKIVSDEKPVINTTVDIKQGTKDKAGTLNWLLALVQSVAPQVDTKVDIQQGKKTETGTLNWLLGLIQAVAPSVNTTVDIAQGSKSSTGTLVWLLELIQSIAPKVDAKAGIDETSNKKGSLPWLSGLFEGLNPTVNANAKFDQDQTKKALTAAVTGITVGLVVAGIATTLGSLTFKANGGFVESGDLFVANENGVPEMVGSFGHQTAVANNDQIVAGIAGGVAAANEEQNALLREQNGLLRGILQKSGNVTIGASAALGRVVNQSMNMYSGLVGG